MDREQYINRLGRTGREGKSSEGILLLAPWEEYFLQEIKDLPIHKLSSPHLDPDMKVKVCSATKSFICSFELLCLCIVKYVRVSLLEYKVHQITTCRLRS